MKIRGSTGGKNTLIIEMAVPTNLFPNKKCVNDVKRNVHINETKRDRNEIN
jgi:hypothetical protein